MRVDSCRRCGTLLSICKYCKVCKQPLEFKCKNCSMFTDDPIHVKCDLQEKLAKLSLTN